MTTEFAHKLMEEALLRADDDLRAAFLNSAVRYARLRTDWALFDPQDRRSLDQTRTAAHEVFIDQCNILSRAQSHNGTGNQWRGELGEDRKVIGDFACQIHLLLGLAAR